jgi:hypothetical protein
VSRLEPLHRGTPAISKRGASNTPCPYERHRPTDWRLAVGGAVTCGVCHLPVVTLDIVRVGQDAHAPALRRRKPHVEVVR